MANTVYTVQFRPSGSGSFAVAGTTQNTNFTESGLLPGTAYDFEVTASVGGNSGPTSSVLTVATAGNTAPNQVGNLTVGTISNTSVQLTVPLNTTGPAPASYTIQERVTGTTPFITASTFAESPDGLVLTSTAGSITDAFGVKYSLVTGSPGPFEVAINNTPDTVANNIVDMVYWNHTVNVLNADNNWFVYNGTPGNYTQLAGDPRIAPNGQTISPSGSSIFPS